MAVILDQVFEKLTDLKMGDYENCLFRNAQFAEADFSQFRFIDCRFEDSDLSLSNFQGTLLQNCHFHHCKILGINFEQINPFGLGLKFEHCLLSHSSFFQLNLSKTEFLYCNLKEVDFTQAKLKGASFAYSNLENTRFENSDLENADFRYSTNLILNPEKNYLKKAKFTREILPGLLTNYNLIIEE